MHQPANYGTYWVRGIWVLLMILAINIVLGLAGGGVAILLRPVLGQSYLVAYAIVLLSVGLPFMGWLFERLASRLPRV